MRPPVLVQLLRKNVMLQNLGAEIRQCLTHFISQYRSRRKNDDPSIGPITIDGAAPEAPWIEPQEPPKAGADSKRLQDALIAIVDDDECVRWGLGAMVESLGHRIATFASAEDYLASDISERTSCLILDVHLPGMSGPGLQAHLIADARCPPTIFVTGRFDETVRKQVTHAGALGYLTKPCSERALLHCMGKALRTSASGSH